jgi:hypothetical protein
MALTYGPLSMEAHVWIEPLLLVFTSDRALLAGLR